MKSSVPLTAVLFLLVFSAIVSAQEADTTFGWKKQAVASLNLTQASFSNWKQGGDNSLAWQVKLATRFDLNEEKWNWTNTSKFELGFAKVAGAEARKSTDALEIESVLVRKLGTLLNPFVAATAKTQFVSGFDFDDDNDTKTKVSKFLDPGYFTQSIGLGYKPNETFRTRMGFTFKETVTSEFSVPYADDPDTDKLEKTRVEPGISSVSNFSRQFHENVLLVSKLDIFTDLEAFDRIDVTWENQLTLKVTKYINVNITVDLLYDKDITSDAQLKEVLGVGFTYTLL